MSKIFASQSKRKQNVNEEKMIIIYFQDASLQKIIIPWRLTFPYHFHLLITFRFMPELLSGTLSLSIGVSLGQNDHHHKFFLHPDYDLMWYDLSPSILTIIIIIICGHGNGDHSSLLLPPLRNQEEKWSERKWPNVSKGVSIFE